MVRCKDRFSNPTTPGTSMSFGLAVAPPGEAATAKDKKDKDKDKSKDEGEKKEKKKEAAEEEGASTLPSKDFEGKWMAEGEYEIKYVAEKAGDYELHLWCDVDGNGVRQKLPGSPFQLHVVAARASASGSLITGADAVRNQPLTAGDRLELGIHFRDDFGNACAPPDRVRANARQQSANGASDDEQTRASGRRSSSPGEEGRTRRGSISLPGGKRGSIGEAGLGVRVEREEGIAAKLVTPQEEEIITDKMRRGDSVGSFNLGYELQVAGLYEAHFTLNGYHLNGSPVCFHVKPAAPSGRLSTLHPPVDTPPVIGVVYEMQLIAEDKYSNKLDRGGANVQARALGPSASPATTVDHGDGTYGVRFTAGAAGEYRVEVRLDNIKIKGSPHLINFNEPTAAQRRQLAANAPDSAAATKAGADGVADEVLGEGADDWNHSSHSPPSLRDPSPDRSQDDPMSPGQLRRADSRSDVRHTSFS
jgi:hypothetical protein